MFLPTPIRFTLCLSLLACMSWPTVAADVYESLEDCAKALSGVSKGPQQLPERPLRVLSWNTMKYSKVGAIAELQSLTRNSDFLFLQEALAHYTAPPAPALSERFFSPGYRRGSVQTGVEIRSAFPADVVCTLSFLEPWLRTAKAVAIARIPFVDHSLLLANLHAINFTLGSSAYSEQLEAIGRLVNAHRGPVIVGGDFNHWNPWRRWVLQTFRNNYTLQEARFSPDWRSRHFGSTVDTFLFRGLRAISAAAIPSDLSDHNPIEMSLQLDPPTPSSAADNPF